MEKVVSLPEPVIQEMIKVTYSASEYLRFAGIDTTQIRIMLEMLRAGAATVNSVSSFEEVMQMLDAPSITEEQLDGAKSWMLMPCQNIPVRTYNHMVEVLSRKVSKST